MACVELVYKPTQSAPLADDAGLLEFKHLLFKNPVLKKPGYIIFQSSKPSLKIKS